MSQIIAYTNNGGTVSILNIAPGIDINGILQSTIINFSDAFITTTDQLPVGYNDSWVNQSGTVVIDLTKAKISLSNQLTIEVTPMIWDLNVFLGQVIAAGKDPSIVYTRINYLNGLPTDSRISAATTIDQLNEIGIDSWDYPVISDMAVNPPLSDPRFNVKNVVNVKQNPGLDEFATISEAINYINTQSPSSTNYFTIKVGPGTYTENSLTIPSYVTIIGTDVKTTMVTPTIPNQIVFNLSSNCQLSTITLLGNTNSLTTGAGYPAISCVDIINTKISNIIIYNFDIGIAHSSVSAITSIIYQDIEIFGNYSYGITNTSSNGYLSSCYIINCFAHETSSSTKTSISNNGPNTYLEIHSSKFSGIGSGAVGLTSQNGGQIIIRATHFENMLGTAIIIQNVGAGPNFQINGTSFYNCVYDFNILNTGTTGYYIGYSLKNNYNIVIGSSFFIANENLNIITVSKRGSNFTSISDAVNSILDSSSTNPYAILVSAGIYVEPQITMKPYLSIVGIAIDATVVSPQSASQHLFIMNTNTELSFMTLQGLNDTVSPGSNYAAVYCEDLEDFAQLHKISIYDFDIGIDQYANTTYCNTYVEYTDINNAFSYAVRNRTNDANSVTTILQLENFYTFPSTVATNTSILNDGAGTTLLIHVAGFEGSGTGATGILLRNGGKINIGATFFQDMLSTGLISDGSGSGAALEITSTTFRNCVLDFDIQNAGTTGYFNGYSKIGNYNINNSSPSLLLTKILV